MNKEEILKKLLPVIGLTSLRVFIHLVDEYMTGYHTDMPEGELWYIPKHKYIMKQERLSSHKYFLILNNLVTLGYVNKKKVGKRLMWSIEPSTFTE